MHDKGTTPPAAHPLVANHFDPVRRLRNTLITEEPIKSCPTLAISLYLAPAPTSRPQLYSSKPQPGETATGLHKLDFTAVDDSISHLRKFLQNLFFCGFVPPVIIPSISISNPKRRQFRGFNVIKTSNVNRNEFPSELRKISPMIRVSSASLTEEIVDLRIFEGVVGHQFRLDGG